MARRGAIRTGRGERAGREPSTRGKRELVPRRVISICEEHLQLTPAINAVKPPASGLYPQSKIALCGGLFALRGRAITCQELVNTGAGNVKSLSDLCVALTALRELAHEPLAFSRELFGGEERHVLTLTNESEASRRAQTLLRPGRRSERRRRAVAGITSWDSGAAAIRDRRKWRYSWWWWRRWSWWLRIVWHSVTSDLLFAWLRS